MVGDEYADYERMQLVADTFCYVSAGGDTESRNAVSHYLSIRSV